MIRARGRLWPEVVAAACCYTAITLLLFHNLLPVLSTSVYVDQGDPVLNTAVLLWNAKTLPLTDAWWNFPSFAPLSGVTSWTEHLLGAYPLTSPIIWITGNAVLAYNTLLLACFALNGTCTFLLLREVTRSSSGAFVGGLAFAFAPYMAVQVAHVQTLMAFGMPLALCGLHGYLRTQRPRALAAFVLGWLSVSLSNAYMLVFFPILVMLWCLWFLRRASWRAWAWIGGTSLATLLPALPLLWGYHVRQTAYGFSRPYAELLSQSPSVVDLTAISHRTVLWSNLSSSSFRETAIFPGLCIFVLAILAVLVRRRDESSRPAGAPSRRQAVAFYSAAAVSMWLLALGPEPTWSGGQSIAYGPYWLLVHLLPLAQRIRVPARAWLPAALCLAVCAGIGASWLASRTRRGWVAVALALAIVGEGWFYDQTYELPAPIEDGLIPSGATVLDLPLLQGFQNASAQYLAVLGNYQVVNGYSGYIAPHSVGLREAIAAHRPEALNVFRRRGDLHVLVRAAVDVPFEDWLKSQEQIQLVAVSGSTRVYRLPRLGPGPATPSSLPLPTQGGPVFTID